MSAELLVPMWLSKELFLLVKHFSFGLGWDRICLWLERARGVEWASPLVGALVAAILSAFNFSWIRLNYREREDSIIAALWSVGMAIGVLFISQTPALILN